MLCWHLKSGCFVLSWPFAAEHLAKHHTPSSKLYPSWGSLGLLEVHAIIAVHTPPHRPSWLRPLIPFPFGLVTRCTTTIPVNTAWLQGLAFSDLGNSGSHTRTHYKNCWHMSGNTLKNYSCQCHSNTKKSNFVFLLILWLQGNVYFSAQAVLLCFSCLHFYNKVWNI